MSGGCGRLHVLGLGFGIGMAMGLMMFAMGLFAMSGYGGEFVRFFGSIYLGYASTFWGSLLGFLWGFVDGFIFGVLIAYFYNYFGCKFCKREEK